MSKPQPSHSPQRLTKSLLALSLFSLSASITACSPPEESAEYSAGDFTSEGGSASNYAPPGPPAPPAPNYPEAGSAAGAEMWEESAGGADLIAPDIDEPEPEPEQGGAEPEIEINPEVDSLEDNLITFAADVDTASYAFARSQINSGRLPAPQSVRLEEFVNYFDYRDEAPANEEEGPFNVSMEAAPSPFGEARELLRVGIKGYEVAREDRPAANLVFLLDVSGSMNSDNKLGLVKRSMSLLLDNLNATDSVSIVTYAGADRIVLRPTEATAREEILAAINNLESGGSTNGAAGINTAYELAQEAFVTGGINRVVLCTDGDFNVGVTGQALYDLIEMRRESGVTLSIFGFGMRGGYGENQMEELSNRGDGNYAYIDTLAEAQRALVDRLTASIFNIAKDVKLQLEVNPLLIKRHRLLGYENRAIADEDFRDDTVDAGEIGAGHTVTALIELERYAEGEAPSVEDLMMGEEQAQVDAAFLNTDAPLAVLRIRSKAPDAGTDDPAKEQRFELSQAELLGDVSEASDALRFGAAVAEFAEILRGSPYVAEIDFEAVKALANGAIIDQDPLMIEFVTIVERAQALFPSTQQP